MSPTHTTPDYFSPAVIMSDPVELKRLIDTYFATIDLPNPASMALHLGFSSAHVMVNALNASDPAITPHAKHILAQGLSRLESELVTKGLLDEVNVTFLKFLLSARMGMVERTEKQVTEHSTKEIKIITATAAPTSLPETEEMLRLETQLAKQTEAERAQLDGTDSSGAHNNNPNSMEDLL